MTKQSDLDLAIINLSYFNLKNTLKLLDVITKSLKYLDIDWEGMTKEQKHRLKEDMKMTSDSVYHLKNAEKAYKGMIRELEIVEQQMDQHTKGLDFDLGTISSLDLLSIQFIYLALTEGNRQNEVKIHNYLKKFSWPPEFKMVYDQLQSDRHKLIMQYANRQTV